VGGDGKLDDGPTRGCSPLVDVVCVVQESPGVGEAVKPRGGGVVRLLEDFLGVGGGKIGDETTRVRNPLVVAAVVVRRSYGVGEGLGTGD
jgi:hypothetical protein